MDVTPATEKQPENPRGPCPPNATDSCNETASASSDLSRSCPCTENESIPPESECESVGVANVRGEGDGLDFFALGLESLDSCVQQSKNLQDAGVLADLGAGGSEVIGICRSARKAIEKCQAGIANANASEAATADQACQNEACQWRVVVLDRFRQDQSAVLERMKQVLTILVGRCSTQTYEDDGFGSIDRKRRDSEQEQVSLCDLMKDRTELHSYALRLQHENRLLKRKLENHASFKQGHEAPPGNEDEDNKSHRWTGLSYASTLEAERRDETLGPWTAAASERNEPTTQRLENASWQTADPPEVLDGRLLQGDINNSCPSEGAMPGLQAPRLDFLGCEVPRNVECSDETMKRKQRKEHEQHMTRTMQQLVEEVIRLRQEQCTVEELRQGLADVGVEEEPCHRGSAMLLLQPTNLYRELGDLAASPGNMPASPVYGFDVFGGPRQETESEQGHSLLLKQFLAWRDVAFFLAFIILHIWQAPGRTIYNKRHSLRMLSPLKSIDWDRWEPAARAEKPFRTKGLLRALRQVVMLMSVVTYLSCRWERELWMAANGQTRRYLIQQLRERDAPWWPVPGVDPGMVWRKGCELWAMLAAQTTGIWASWALERWFWPPR